jgi:hypothetical protein
LLSMLTELSPSLVTHALPFSSNEIKFGFVPTGKVFVVIVASAPKMAPHMIKATVNVNIVEVLNNKLCYRKNPGSRYNLYKRQMSKYQTKERKIKKVH